MWIYFSKFLVQSNDNSIHTWYKHSDHSCRWINRVHVKTSRPRQNSCHIADNLFKCFFVKGNVWISMKISEVCSWGSISDIPALCQRMAWYRRGDKLLSEPMMLRLPTQIYVLLGLNELTHACDIANLPSDNVIRMPINHFRPRALNPSTQVDFVSDTSRVILQRCHYMRPSFLLGPVG